MSVPTPSKVSGFELENSECCAWKVCLKLSSNQDLGFICVLEDLMKSLDKCFFFFYFDVFYINARTGGEFVP